MKDVWKTPTIQRKEKRFGKHPTQKPLSVVKRIIESSTNNNSLVLDPFVGSGTTCVACRQLGVRSIGIDMEYEYLNIAKNRIKDYLNERTGNIWWNINIFQIYSIFYLVRKVNVQIKKSTHPGAFFYLECLYIILKIYKVTK